MPNDLTLEQMIEEMRGRVAYRPAPPPPEIKIPNVYRRLHPVDGSQAVTKEDTRPAEVEMHTTIKYILRNGDQGQSLGRRMWWGDRQNEEGAIVAYRIIKLEKGWVDWGYRFDRGEQLDIIFGGIPERLDPTTRVQIWLRDYPDPQPDIRPASSWDWTVSGEGGGDIMQYKIISR